MSYPKKPRQQRSLSNRFAVFVPASADVWMAITVIPGSAIVGSVESAEAERVAVYYEGNQHGAINVKTYADRAKIASERLVTHAPTVAFAAVPRSDLLQIGWFDPEAGITLLDDEEAKKALASWLGVEVIEENELHFSK